MIRGTLLQRTSVKTLICADGLARSAKLPQHIKGVVLAFISYAWRQKKKKKKVRYILVRKKVNRQSLLTNRIS